MPGSFEAATVANLPLAYYRLNEMGNVQTLATNRGTGGAIHDGVYQAAAISGAAGAVGTDPAVSGPSGKVTVPYDAALNPPGPFTVEAWLKPAAALTGGTLTCPLSSVHIASPRSGWLVYQSATGWNFRTYNQNGTATLVNITGGGTLVTNTWYHLVAVWDGTNGYVYVNGALAATSPATDPSTNFVANPDGAFTIGARSDGPTTFPYNGVADEVALYSTALTASTIAANYAAATTNAAGYAAQIGLLNPVAYWRLNEAFGPVIAVNHGTRGTSGNGTYTPNSFAIGTPGLALGVAGPQPPSNPGFASTNKAVQIDNGWVAAPALNMNTNTVTITAWIQRIGDNANFDGLVMTTRANSEPVSGIHFGPEAGNELRYSWNDAGNTYNFASGLFVPEGVWTFVALVVEPAKATLYMGAAGACLQSSVNTVAAANAAFAQGLFIGRDSTARIYSGNIDDVAIYNRSLSPEEMGVLYSAGVPPIPPSIAADPQSQSLVESDSATFSISACGSGVLTYQWYRNGAAISGANNASYTLNDLCATNSGDYTVVVCGSSCVTSSVPAMLTVAALTNSGPLNQDLVMHLKFNNNYADSSGQANNGTAAGAPTFVAGQIGGTAARLNTAGAVHNYVSVAPAPSLAFGGADNFSVAFWLKFTGAFQDLPIIGNAINSTYQPGWVFSESGGQIEWTLNGVINADPVGGPLINDGNWHHIVASFDQLTGIADTYVDGLAIDSRSIAGVGSLDIGTGIALGQDPSGTYAADGAFDIDDVGVWRRALTRFEVRAIHAAGLEGADLSAASVLPQITITAVGGNANVSWLATPAGNCYTLESAGSVNGPYTAVVATPALAGGRYSATVPVMPTNRFYRLRK